MNRLRPAEKQDAFLYQENHALDAWFKRAYGDEAKKKTPSYEE